MKLLVLSDTHGRRDRVEEVLNLHADADAVLFLGDGLREVSDLVEEKGIRLEAVRGNCDFFSFFGDNAVAEEQILPFGAYTVLMMHGHTRNVKGGMDRALAYAARTRVDLLLYGHTHIPQELYLPEGSEAGGEVLTKPLRVFNPGSLGQPNATRPSYGLIQMLGRDLLLSHGSL